MLFKQYISRTTTYLSVINAGMILFLFLSKLKEVGIIGWDLDKYTISIFIIGTLGLLVVGWFEIKILKGLQEESTIAFGYQPPMVEMKKKIDEMYEDFKKNKESSNAKS
jgi:hypothetical protein